MRCFLILITLIAFASSCEKQVCNCEIDRILQFKNDSIINKIKQSESQSFKAYWTRFKEPILGEQDVESYRFSITVLLYDYQKIYRIDRKRNNVILNVKEYSVPTTITYRSDSLVRESSRFLTDQEWLKIKNSLDDNCFWTLPTDVDKMVLDGASWTLEGFNPKNNNCTGSSFHFAHRASPDTSSFRTISEDIMALDSFVLRDFYRNE